MAKGQVQTAPPETKSAPVPVTSRALRPFEEIDRVFERLFDRGWLRPSQWENPLWSRIAELEPQMPRIDVIDREKEVYIRAEIPGVNKQDLDVSVNEDSVTIKGETRHEAKEETGDFYRCEIAHGGFVRTVALPCAVDADKAAAKLNDGVLELTMPKVKQSRRRKVEIK